MQLLYSPQCQLLQLPTKVFVVQEVAWKPFEGIVAGDHIEGGAEGDGTPKTIVVIVMKVFGQDDPTEERS